MFRNSLMAAALCLIAFSSAYSGDLYLLSIQSQQELQQVKQTVESARGTIGGRFIVELNADQVNFLRQAGIAIELIKGNVDFNRIYAVSPIHPEIMQKAISFSPVYSSGENYLADLDESAASLLKSSGYVVLTLTDKKSPFFHSPKFMTVSPLDIFPNDTLAGYIVQDSIYRYDSILQAFQTRYIYTDSAIAARNWLVNKFLSFGYTNVKYDTFYVGYTRCYNVICIKTGITYPDKYVVVGGHYDSWNGQSDPMVYAPGADDNGSGTAAVLELARVLKNVPLNKSVMFVAFSAEETGLDGSAFIANKLYNQGTSVEFMLNFDMIAFTADAYANVKLYSGPFPAYAQLMMAAAQRVTSLIPEYAGAAQNSDHASFVDYGFYAAYAQEGDFNNDGWHTNLDITSRLNYPYVTEVIKMAVAGLGQVDNAASPTLIDRVADIGDGQSLRVFWNTDCRPTYSYKVLHGTQSGVYADTVDVPPGMCTFDLTGLTLGQTYYVAVLGLNSEGHGPIFVDEDTGASYIVPRAPVHLAAEPDTLGIILSWKPNSEIDLDHYIIMRRFLTNQWEILQNNVTDTSYIDAATSGHTSYSYEVVAVDNDGNQSQVSVEVSAVRPTFDGGVLFVEETASGGLNPSEAKQTAYYDSIFADVPYTKYGIHADSIRLTRSLSGQYSSLLWFDDDMTVHLLGSSLDSLKWYLRYRDNMLLAGWQTIYWIVGTQQLYPGNFVYDNFAVSRLTNNSAFDFRGALGVGDWPELVTKTDLFGGTLPDISVFDLAPGGQTIYTYNSQSGNSAFQGKPVGVLYDTGHGKRIALSFPIYRLTEASAQAFMAKVFALFGEAGAPRPYGDVDHSGSVNILDASFLINYLYKSGPAPDDLNYADVNASCSVNVLDATYTINFLYKAGPVPLQGCVH